MTRRRILNVTSRKKSDVRICFAGNGTTAPTAPGSFNLTGGNRYMFVYQPTMMDKDPGLPYEGDPPNTRTTDSVFMRGYKETFIMRTDNGEQWNWRRICFTYKGGALRDLAGVGTPLGMETVPNGWVRPVTPWAGSSALAVQDLLFQGQAGVDWTTFLTAPIDNSMVNIKYDKVHALRSGNQVAHTIIKPLWHPMNAMFHYETNENGGDSSVSTHHTTGKAGMGDYVIVDLIECSSSSSAVTAQLDLTGRLYWHER